MHLAIISLVSSLDVIPHLLLLHRFDFHHYHGERQMCHIEADLNSSC